MKLTEAALFKLALNGKITLGEAKALNALDKKMACSKETLLHETGLEKPEIEEALRSLVARKITCEKNGIYFTESFGEKICGLIEESEKIVAVNYLPPNRLMGKPKRH